MAEALLVNGVALVAYVDGVGVDSEGRAVKGAPKEPPVTDPSQQPHAMAALNSDERSAAILATAFAKALAGTGVASAPALPPAAPAELPTLAELPDHLAGLTSADAVRALQAQDERKGAVSMYEARLAELSGDGEE